MLKGNLSTRPFYNDRLISLIVGLVVMVALALTAFNGWQLYSLSKRRAELRADISRHETEAGRIQRDADLLRKSVDASYLTLLANATHEANNIIDQRTFSWTTFFGVIEKALPLDVRLVAIQPRIERKDFKVALAVISKSADDINRFVDVLDQTGVFLDVLPKTQTPQDDGTYLTVLDTTYVAPSSRPATPKPGKGRP
jgi:hypothetical protein